jgi:hypothetical protein
MPQAGAEAGKAAAVQLIDALMPRCDAAFLLQELSAPRSLMMEWEEISTGSIREPVSRWG